MASSALIALRSRLFTPRASSTRPSLLSRWKLYWTNVATDYKNALIELKNDAVARPIKAAMVTGALSLYYVAFNSRPNLNEFIDKVREARADVVLVPSSIRRSSSMHFLESLNELSNHNRLRTQNLLGVATLLWQDEGDRDSSLYALQCPHLKIWTKGSVEASRYCESTMCSRFDTVYRKLLLSRFFTQGWGHPDHLAAMFRLRRQFGQRPNAFDTVDPEQHPIIFDEDPFDAKAARKREKTAIVVNGNFVSPVNVFLPKQMIEPELHHAHIQLILPQSSINSSTKTTSTPLCIQYAGTGDHFFWRRRHMMALPLAKSGVASILIENPYYGQRRPSGQRRSSLRNVSDLFVMGGALILETLVLLHFCHKHNFWPVCLHGISMGGHMASLAATAWPGPLGLAACLASCTAADTFTKGVMADAIPWNLLDRQIAQKSYLELMEKANLEAFRAGVEFSLDVEPSSSSSLSSWLSSPAKSATSLAFMRGIMDECTHLKNYSKPFDPSLAVVVAAERDAYTPVDNNVMAIPDLWPGSTMTILPGRGHVASYLLEQNFFRKTIMDVIEMTRNKYAEEPYLLPEVDQRREEEL